VLALLALNGPRWNVERRVGGAAGNVFLLACSLVASHLLAFVQSSTGTCLLELRPIPARQNPPAPEVPPAGRVHPPHL
jgi:hypothetical protein